MSFASIISIIVAAIVSHAVACVAGGYLHYRFGKAVKAIADQIKNLPKIS
jgi:hypothetical protein